MKMFAMLALALGVLLLLLLTTIPATVLGWVLAGLDLLRYLTEEMLRFAIAANHAGNIIADTIQKIAGIFADAFG